MLLFPLLVFAVTTLHLCFGLVENRPWTIARVFGFEPLTIKLNGHFIGRGVDLVASSVTWKSLFSFFSAKGLPTRKDDGGALDVTKKFCKAGKKRGHDSQDAVNGVCKEAEGGNFGDMTLKHPFNGLGERLQI